MARPAMKKRVSVEIEVPILRDDSQISLNVPTMLESIRSMLSMDDKGKELLDQYAKLYMLDKAGVQSYPMMA